MREPLNLCIRSSATWTQQAAPISVWGSDAEGGTTASTRMVTGAAKGRSHTTTHAESATPEAGQQGTISPSRDDLLLHMLTWAAKW
jgi:hypothetical protein